MMKCICCQSTKFISQPLGLARYYGCPGCGLLFRQRDKSADARDVLICHYQDVDPHETVADSKKAFFKSSLRCLSSKIRQRQRSLLDVGCGYGYFLDLAARDGWNVSGVEIASAAVESAKEKVGTKNIFTGSLKEAHYPDSSFDAITLWDVADMIEDPFEELRECFRIIEQGGVIGIRVRNVTFQKTAYRVYLLLGKIASRLALRRPFVFHPYCFTGKSIRQLLLRSGFTKIEITNSPLTRGDPYAYTPVKGMVKMTKHIIHLVSGLVLRISAGRWIIGPSLLIWAEKPQSEKKPQDPFTP